jgi:MFS family permease
MIYFAGGLEPIFQIWLSKVTAAENRGSTFGWAASARSVGWLGAPLASGIVASVYSIRTIFFIGAVLFFALVPLVLLVVKRIDRNRDQKTEEVGGGVERLAPPV